MSQLSSTERLPVLWAHRYPPWSPWVNSGASLAICTELKRRKMLRAAIAPDFVSRLYAHGPGFGYELLRRLSGRLSKPTNSRPKWNSEDEPTLAKWLSRMPPKSPVVYVFGMPEPSDRFDLRRVLFLNLSLLDARRTSS